MKKLGIARIDYSRGEWRNTPDVIFLDPKRRELLVEKIEKWEWEEKDLQGGGSFNIDIPPWMREFIRGADDWAQYCHLRALFAKTLIRSGQVKKQKSDNLTTNDKEERPVPVSKDILLLAWFAVNDYNQTGGENIKLLR